MHRRPLLALIDDYAHRFPAEQVLCRRFREFVRNHADCFHRSCEPGHVTGSAWLVDGAGSRVLLTHHRKLGRWLQLGGHSDGDPDPLQVAMREAHEESGLTVRPLTSEIFDLDIHEIPARRTRRGLEPAHLHYDVRFALQAQGSERYRVSDESLDLAWVDVAGLSELTTEASILRMADKWVDGSAVRQDLRGR